MAKLRSETPVKRGRGRPPKNHSNSPASQSDRPIAQPKFKASTRRTARKTSPNQPSPPVGRARSSLMSQYGHDEIDSDSALKSTSRTQVSVINATSPLRKKITKRASTDRAASDALIAENRARAKALAKTQKPPNTDRVQWFEVKEDGTTWLIWRVLIRNSWPGQELGEGTVLESGEEMVAAPGRDLEEERYHAWEDAKLEAAKVEDARMEAAAKMKDAKMDDADDEDEEEEEEEEEISAVHEGHGVVNKTVPEPGHVVVRDAANLQTTDPQASTAQEDVRAAPTAVAAAGSSTQANSKVEHATLPPDFGTHTETRAEETPPEVHLHAQEGQGQQASGSRMSVEMVGGRAVMRTMSQGLLNLAAASFASMIVEPPNNNSLPALPSSSPPLSLTSSDGNNNNINTQMDVVDDGNERGNRDDDLVNMANTALGTTSNHNNNTLIFAETTTTTTSDRIARALTGTTEAQTEGGGVGNHGADLARQMTQGGYSFQALSAGSQGRRRRSLSSQPAAPTASQPTIVDMTESEQQQHRRPSTQSCDRQ